MLIQSFLVCTGRAQSILTAERIALNFMQRMSGIATLTKVWKQSHDHLITTSERNERWLWCCHQCELWCCIIFKLVLSLCAIPKSHDKIRGPPKTIAFKGEHHEWAQTSWPTPFSPKGKPLGSRTVGWNTPTMIGWTIDCRVHQQSSARKVIHLGTILGLGSLTYGIWVKALGHPLITTSLLSRACLLLFFTHRNSSHSTF